MKLKNLCLLSIMVFALSGCTAEVQSSLDNVTSKPTTTTNSSPTALASPTPTATASPTAQPTKASTARPSATAKASVESKSEIKSYSTSSSNSQTNVNINSNGTNVKIYTKDGKRYAELNGKAVELDANGCYDYNEGGTKIHSCVNN